jgi:hypothetical protein
MFQKLIRSIVSLCVFVLLPALGIAQEIKPDGPADSPLLRERARAHRAQKQERGPDRDDPTTRMYWQRLINGIPTREFKQQLFRLREERGARERAARLAQQGRAPDPSTIVAVSPAWVPIGPTGADYEQNFFTLNERDSGRARTILPHPNDPDTLYFLTSGGGLWVTHNFTAGSTTWAPLTDTIATTGGGSVAFGRAVTTPATTTLYLGTGDPFDIINIGGQMFKSVDGGATWSTAVDLLNAFSVRDVKVDTTQAQDIVLVATDVGLFRSADGGTSYSEIALGGTTGLTVWSIVQTSAGWLANAQPCGGQIPADACGFAAINGEPSTIYISTDHGATWNAITNTGNVFTGAGRTTLAVGAPGDAIVYALAEDATSQRQLDVFRSTNGGQTWVANGVNSTKAPTNPNGDNPNMDIIGDQSWYNQMILVDPTVVSRNTLYIGGNFSTAKSTDGGATWTLITNWLGQPNVGLPYSHADHHAAAFTNVGGTRRLLFGNDGGIFLSADDGATWTSSKNNGLQTHLFYALSSMPAIPGSVVAGAQDVGTRVRSGNTSIYNQTFGGDGFGTAASQANSNLFAGTVEGSGVFHDLNNQSPDAQALWDEVDPPVNNGVFFTPIGFPSAAADPSGLVFYTYTFDQVFKTADGGVTWTVIGQVGTTIINPAGLRDTSRGIGVGPDLNHVAVAGFQGHVDITTDGGTTWNDFSIGATVAGFGFISSINWGDANTLYITSENPSAGNIRLVKGTFNGATWIFAGSDTGLPDVQSDRVILDPRDVTNQTLYAATDLGVFRSTNAGATWANWGTGLPNVRVSDLYASPDGSFLIASTYGRGIWELPLLSFVSASLTDDITTCDSDGSLDNGETGHLTITLRNDGSGTLNAISATVSSSNLSVSFPNGASLSFPPAGPGATTTAQIPVDLNGASGIQQMDFTISFTDTSLSLPAPGVTAHASFRGNFKEVPASSAMDDVEASATTWTVGGSAESKPLIFSWKREEVSPLNHRWIGVDSDAIADQTLTSPVFNVGAGPFTITFSHRYVFDFSNTFFCDGSVVEISSDSGVTWTDVNVAVPGSLSPAYDHVLTLNGAVCSGNPLQGRSAFSARSAGYPAMHTETIGLATAFANKNVQIRFRIGTDEIQGESGWVIDNIAFTGITNTPFATVVAQTVACGSSVALDSNNNPSLVGQSVTFTATVSGGATPTGTVTFKDNGSAISGAVALNGSGQAQFTTSALTLGSHPITADYSGDGTHPAGSSATLNQVVNNPPTTTTLAPAGPVTFGSLLTLTATVAPNTATGTVTFKDGATTIGSGTLSGGTASMTTLTLSGGSHSITAVYGGDANFSGSTSAPQTVVVNPAATATALSASANPVPFGTSVTFTAMVTSSAGTPTGSVSFTDGATTLGTGTLSAGTATFTTSTLAAGAHTIKATYSATANFDTSASTTLNFTVMDFTLPATLTPASQNVNSGQSANYTIAIGQTGGFSSSISFTCSLPAIATTCMANPASQTPGGSVTITATTTLRTLLPPPISRRLPRYFLPVLLLAMALLFARLLYLEGPRRRRLAVAVPFAALLLLVVYQAVGCGGSSTPPVIHGGTPAGTYTITVTGTSGASSHTSMGTLVVN